MSVMRLRRLQGTADHRDHSGSGGGVQQALNLLSEADSIPDTQGNATKVAPSTCDLIICNLRLQDRMQGKFGTVVL